MILLAFLLQATVPDTQGPARTDKTTAEGKPSAAAKAKAAKAAAGAKDTKTTKAPTAGKAEKDAPTTAKKTDRPAVGAAETPKVARSVKPPSTAKVDKPAATEAVKGAVDENPPIKARPVVKAAREPVADRIVPPSSPRNVTPAVVRDPAPVAPKPLAPAVAPVTQAPRTTRAVSLLPPPGVDTARTLDAAGAIDLFKMVCWDSFRDPQAFHAAVAGTPLALNQPPRAAAAARTDPAQPSEVYRSDEAVLTYAASDSLPASVPSRQCSLKVRLSGASDQLALAARIGSALGLPNGRTRTGASLAITSWDVAGADNRTVRLLAVSRNGRAGGTDLRLSALLLATAR